MSNTDERPFREIVVAKEIAKIRERHGHFEEIAERIVAIEGVMFARACVDGDSANRIDTRRALKEAIVSALRQCLR